MVSVLGVGSGRRPTLKIQPYQGIFHLHPPGANELEYLTPDAPDAHDTLLGQVVLSLPKPREFTCLTVRLVAHYTLTLPGQPVEKGTLGSWETDAKIPRHLDKGEHTFAWSLKVPRSSPPYERCPFGRVYYKLVAVADSPAGAIKSDQFTEVIAVPALDVETSALNEQIEGFNAETGPYLMSLLSEHLTVGGGMHFSLNLACVPQDLCLHSITATIVQSYTLRSHAKPGQASTPPSHKRLVFHLDHLTPLWGDESPSRRPGTVLRTSSYLERPPGLLAALRAGESLQVSHVARLPDDDLLRATTLPGTRAPIRITHTIMLDVEFSTPGTAARILRTERPLTILSCCCFPDSLVLPPYACVAERLTREGIRHEPCRAGKCVADGYYCICLSTFDTLIQPLLGIHKAHALPEPKHDEIFAANKHIRSSILP